MNVRFEKYKKINGDSVKERGHESGLGPVSI